jgi:hypothetical protein
MDREESCIPKLRRVDEIEGGVEGSMCRERSGGRGSLAGPGGLGVAAAGRARPALGPGPGAPGALVSALAVVGGDARAQLRAEHIFSLRAETFSSLGEVSGSSVCALKPSV